MNAPVQQDARLALLEAELLYLCADLGSDVLEKAIDMVEALHAGQDVPAPQHHPGMRLVPPGPCFPALDATG